MKKLLFCLITVALSAIMCLDTRSLLARSDPPEPSMAGEWIDSRNMWWSLDESELQEGARAIWGLLDASAFVPWVPIEWSCPDALAVSGMLWEDYFTLAVTGYCDENPIEWYFYGWISVLEGSSRYDAVEYYWGTYPEGYGDTYGERFFDLGEYLAGVTDGNFENEDPLDDWIEVAVFAPYWAAFELTVDAVRDGDDPVNIYEDQEAVAGFYPMWFHPNASFLPAGLYTSVLAKAGAGPGWISQIPQQVSCGDERTQMIREYDQVNLAPNCPEFSTTRHSQFFTFGAINTGDYAWALIRDPLIAAASSGFGLDKWQTEFGAQRAINSGYRNPARNSLVGGAPTSRHMHGDAADMDVVSNGQTEWTALRDAAVASNADFVEPSNGPCGFGCVHADWRNHNGDYE